jgi:hypothetical protein
MFLSAGCAGSQVHDDDSLICAARAERSSGRTAGNYGAGKRFTQIAEAL